MSSSKGEGEKGRGGEGEPRSRGAIRAQSPPPLRPSASPLLGPQGRAPSAPNWRLILDEEHGAAWNMAVDEAILDAVAAGVAPPTLRLYRWEVPAVSVGRFQSIERGIDTDACRALDIPIVRRPTGGRGILHGGDQTLCVAVPMDDLGRAGRSVIESYRLFSSGIVCALAFLNTPVALGVCERRIGGGGDCFAARSQADLLTADGEKLVGSAQCRREGVVLQQSSLRHRPPEIEPGRVFVGPVDEASYPLAEVDEVRIAEALCAGFGQALNVRLSLGSLAGWEEERAGILVQQAAVTMRQTVEC